MSLQVSAALESKHVAPDLMCKLAVADDDYTHHDIKDAGYEEHLPEPNIEVWSRFIPHNRAH